MYNHRQICSTCEGKKRIVCCSIDDNTQCQTVTCPGCNGTGYVIDQKKLSLKIALLIGIVIFVVGFLVGAGKAGLLI